MITVSKNQTKAQILASRLTAISKTDSDLLLEISKWEHQSNTPEDFKILEEKIEEFKSKFILTEDEWENGITNSEETEIDCNVLSRSTGEKLETLIRAYKSGKTIQSKSSGEWKDFVPQNQVDSPNWEYGGIENWRIKPDEITEESSPGYNKQISPVMELAEKLRKGKSDIVRKIRSEYDQTFGEIQKNPLVNEDYKPDYISFGLGYKKGQGEGLYTKEEVLDHLNHLLFMRSSEIDLFTDDDNKITMKWFEQFKKN